MRYFLIALTAVLMSCQPGHASNCDEAPNNAAYLDCIVKEYEALEAQRLAIEDSTWQKAVDFDEMNKEMGEPDARNAEATLESRDAFQDYRTAECARQRNMIGMGSMAAHFHTSCMIVLTQNRIEALKMGTDSE